MKSIVSWFIAVILGMQAWIATGFWGENVAGAATVHAFRQQDAAMSTVQGNCTDGTHLYQFLLKDNGTEQVEIQKIRLRDWKLMQVVSTQNNPAFSGYGIYHGGDVCYNPDLGQLVAIAYSAHGRAPHTVVFLNPETLLPVGKRTIAGVRTFYAIDYDAASHRYVATLTGPGGNRDFVTYDASFNKIAQFPIAPAEKTSALDCDANYIYCLENDPVYDTFDRCQLHVFDWNGGYYGRVRIPAAGEIEDIFTYDGSFYVAFNMIQPGGRADPMTLRRLTIGPDGALAAPPAFIRSNELALYFMSRMLDFTSATEGTFVRWFR